MVCYPLAQTRTLTHREVNHLPPGEAEGLEPCSAHRGGLPQRLSEGALSSQCDCLNTFMCKHFSGCGDPRKQIPPTAEQRTGEPVLSSHQHYPVPGKQASQHAAQACPEAFRQVTVNQTRQQAQAREQVRGAGWPRLGEEGGEGAGPASR